MINRHPSATSTVQMSTNRPTRHHIAKLAVIATTAALTMSLAACGGTATDGEAAQRPGSIPANGDVTRMKAICDQVFASDHTHVGKNRLILLVDGSASVSAVERRQLPTQISDAVIAASKADNTLTMISIDGDGQQPNILLKDASLSTDGDRASLDVDDIARIMPSCVTLKASEVAPAGNGTDIGRAVQLAAENAQATDTFAIWSDGVWNAGSGALGGEARLDAKATDAAEASAKAAPSDLKGARVIWSGVGNTSAPLLPATRQWLLAYAKALVGNWHGKADGIKLDAVNAEPQTGSADRADGTGSADGNGTGNAEHATLPNDPLPNFPARSCSGSTMSFEISGINFDGDSANLTPTAASLLDEPVRLLSDGSRQSTATVTGHTASLPSANAEQLDALGLARANSVKSALVDRGVDASRVAVRSAGDREPLAEDLNADGTQNANAAAERRATIEVKGARAICEAQ